MKKTILITGSSRGIGAAVARLAVANGYEVILHGHKLTDHLQELSEELSSRYVTFDIKVDEEIKYGLDSLSSIDGLVHSAGINISKPFEELTNDDWKEIYEANVFGVANVTRHALPLLSRAHTVSRIVNIASMKGTYSAVGRVAYASSKAAVINLTTGLAKELAPNILVNCVSPGFTMTEMTQSTWSERIQTQVDSILLGRMADVNEIANVVIFLCSEQCSYITGQNIIVDGGYGIKNE